MHGRHRAGRHDQLDGNVGARLLECDALQIQALPFRIIEVDSASNRDAPSRLEGGGAAALDLELALLPFGQRGRRGAQRQAQQAGRGSAASGGRVGEVQPHCSPRENTTSCEWPIVSAKTAHQTQ
jgi:hypothetical protein